MFRSVLTLLALSLVGSNALAQGIAPPAKAGVKSLNFTFGGLGAFGLTGSGPAGGVGVSYFMGPTTALRLGLQVRKSSRTLSWNSPAGAAGADGNESGMSLGVAADYLKFMHGGSSRVRPYLGGGIGVTNVTNSSKPSAATGAIITETKNAPGGITMPGFAAPGMTIDVHASLGAEFFLFNEISVAGEYALNVVNRTMPADAQAITGGTTVTTKGNPSTSILGFGTAGATIRIYF